ncbi:hypothetical protein HID58_007550, partial [Brassica napus]
STIKYQHNSLLHPHTTMSTRGRLKLNFIDNKSARNQTFKKRTRGFMKKAKELSTLCGIKVSVVIKSCDNAEPEFWPSREGAEAVHSEFMKVVETQGFSKMHNHESYLLERIQKDGEKARRLHAENREIELREVMFDLLKGKTLMPHQYGDPSFMRELNLFIGGYANRVTYRTQFLEGSVEPVPPNFAGANAHGPVVDDVNPVVVGTEGSVINPTEAYDHMPQYDGMDMSVNVETQPWFNGSSQGMNVNHQEPFQYQTPPNSYDHIQPMFNGSSQGMNMKYEEPFQYQPHGNLYDQMQPMFYGSSQDMYTGLSHDQGQSSNTTQQFMSLLMGRPQQMSDVQDLASVASMDDNNNRYQQLPVTSQMPSTTTTTTAAANLSGHSINNGWPTKFGLD